METQKQYVNLVDYLQKELDKEYPDRFKVSSERNLDTDLNNTVIVQQLAGTTTQYSATIPYQIDIITKEPDDVMAIFTKYAKDHNRSTFTQTLCIGTDETGNEKYQTNVIQQNYNTPAIFEKDIEALDNHYARIVVFSTMFILFKASNVESITIDGEQIDFINGNMSYVSELKSIKKSGRETNKNVGISSAISLTFAIASQDGLFTKAQHKLRTGERKRNAPFNVVVELTDGTTESYSMIIQTAVLTFGKNGTPSYQVTMLELDASI